MFPLILKLMVMDFTVKPVIVVAMDPDSDRSSTTTSTASTTATTTFTPMEDQYVVRFSLGDDDDDI